MKKELRSKEQLYIIKRIQKYLWRQQRQDYIHLGNYFMFAKWLNKLRYKEKTK